MPLVTCPACGGDDLSSVGNQEGSEISLRCESCGHEWFRTPALVCGRCSSSEIEIGAYEGWGYDDEPSPDVAPADREWSHIDREVYRCTKCNLRWRASGTPRPYSADSSG